MQEQTSREPAKAAIIETYAAQRLDRLPWGRFHTLVAIALGVTWILDGLQVTWTGSVAGALKASPSLRLTDSDVGLAASFYLIGAVTGALFFGWLADWLGRRILFFVTLGLFVVASVATAFTWDLASFCAFRFLTGAAIGGEYAAVNSTIQEMIPARFRGRTDLILGGTFWIGGALGAVGSIVLLNPAILDPEIGWRFGFFAGGALGLIILFLRSFLPESPRWLVIHGREPEAEKVVGEIEERFRRHGTEVHGTEGLKPSHVRPRTHTPLPEVFRTIFVTYRRRALVALTLMTTQAFFYNAIFFTYALVLTKFYGVPAHDVGWYILPFALANVLGPIVIGPLFDIVGRRPMIAFTYATSGVLLVMSGWLFMHDHLSATWQTLAWSLVFFFASPAAGSAYLTVSEVFPVEIRALAIAIFFAFGTAIGGAAAPWFFGMLIETGSRESVFIGYCIGAALMIIAAAVQAIWGVDSERKALEDIAPPLSSADVAK